MTDELKDTRQQVTFGECRHGGCTNVADSDHGACENHAWLFTPKVPCARHGCEYIAQSSQGYCATRCKFLDAGARAERERIVAILREVLGNWEPECSGCDSFEAFEDAIDHVRGGMHDA